MVGKVGERKHKPVQRKQVESEQRRAKREASREKKQKEEDDF